MFTKIDCWGIMSPFCLITNPQSSKCAYNKRILILKDQDQVDATVHCVSFLYLKSLGFYFRSEFYKGPERLKICVRAINPYKKKIYFTWF